MRIASGVTDQIISFVAVDATDFATRETGLSSFTVYRSRNGGTATAMTTPTVAELDATNMPGVYTLLLDEDMTIGGGNDTEEMVFHITQASMAPVTRTIELFVPTDVAAALATYDAPTKAEMDSGFAGLNDLSAAQVNAEVDTAISDAALATAANLATVDSNVDAILADTNELQGNQGDWATATGFATAADLVTVDANVDSILVDTGTTIPGQIAALNDLDATGVRAAVGLASANLDTQIGAIDTNVDAVLVDTNELQANQGNWITATGFATSGALATVDSNVDAILVDTGTTLPATLSGLSTFDATTDTVDVGAIDGSTTAAARLSDSAETMVLGAAITGTLSTTEMSTDLTEATDDHYNGRVIIWTSGVLVNQATDITDYNGTTKALTYTATTEAPSNGDTFIIV